MSSLFSFRSSICHFSLFAIGGLLCFQSTAEPVVIGTVGTQVLDVGKTGERYQLVSIPFFKMAEARGRLDSKDDALLQLVDDDASFENLSEDESYFLRIRSSSEKGAWFLIESAGDNWSDEATKTLAKVTNNDQVSSVSNLVGDEVFSVHALFSIAELFPEDGSVLSAGKVDVQASQIHLFKNGSFVKYWLSDGSITDQAGWYVAENNALRYAGKDALLPGCSFFVVLPVVAESAIQIRVMGEVLNDSIRIPLEDGFNFVAAEYNLSRIDSEGNPSFAVKDLGLTESGFDAGASANSGDQLLIFDVSQETFGSGFWLEQNNSEDFWKHVTDATAADDAVVSPGGGFVIWNKGNRYIWTQGQ